VNGVAERVAAEDARSRADEDHVGGAAEIVDATDPQRRLGVRVREDRASAPRLEAQLEATVPSNLGCDPRIYVS